MPFFVGPGSAPDGGLEMKSDRVGFPTATSDPGSAVIGDMYVHTVGAGATFMIYDGTGWFTADAVPFSATGGTKTTSGGDTIHTFTAPGDFVVPSGSKSKNIELLMVGGGGGGGNDNGGGGGAGALIYKSARPISGGTYPVVIGPGGAKGVSPGEANQNGTSGGDTTFDGLTAGGGGGGSGDANTSPGTGISAGGSGGGGGMGNQPRSGGSGGGSPTPAAVISNPTSADSPDSGWTQPGGSGSAYNAGTGGGGGGAADGGGGSGPDGNFNGGDGLTFSISGSPVTYAGGGGGGGTPGPGGSGGAGGGGGGDAPSGSQPPFNGTANTGGGGGGGKPSGGNGGDGGSGIVIIRYAT